MIDVHDSSLPASNDKTETSTPKPLRKPFSWLGLLALLMALIALGISIVPLFHSLRENNAPLLVSTTDDMKLQLDQVKTGQAALKTKLDQTLSDMQASIEAFEEKAAANPPAAPGTNLSPETVSLLFSKIDGLEKRLAALETAAKEKSLQHQALALGVAQLKSAIDSGLPYDFLLNSLQILTAEDGQALVLINALRPTAAKGSPTLEGLKQLWMDASDDIVRDGTVSTEQGLWARLWKRLQNIIVVRPVGLVEGATSEAIVARVEYYLGQNNLSQALADAEKLPSPQLDKVTAWLSQAHQYQANHQAIDALMAHSLASLGTTP